MNNTIQGTAVESDDVNMPVFVSDDSILIFEVVNLACLCSITGTFGVAANIINIIIFQKQGFKNTVNIGFLGLAISDTFCLLFLIWGSICMNPLFTASMTHWFPMEVMYLTVGWPHVCFSRITGCITVYITAERYLSIALPLKVKNIITPKTATLAVGLIYFVNLSTLVPEYATSYLGWGFFPSRNKTLIGMVFTNSRKSVEGVVFVLHFMLGMVSFIGVILFTTLLVIKLGQSSSRRKGLVSSHSKNEAISSRDKKTVKMVVFIACVLIVCYSPGALMGLATFIVGEDMAVRGKYINMCEALWTTVHAVQSINSSVNIFIYYSMSSKYRETFKEIICQHKYTFYNSNRLI